MRPALRSLPILVVLVTFGCTGTPSPAPAPPATSAPATLPGPFELEEMTVDALQQAMSSGKLTSRRITDLYLGSSTTPAAVAGYPSITVPAGEVAGLPVGVSFFSTAWTEATLIKFAYAFEQATKARKVPALK